MKCVVCKSQDCKLIMKNHNGYVKGTFYDIFKCNECDTHFIDITKLNKKVYEDIYSSESTPSYDRYYQYAKQIKLEKNPIEFLCDKEYTYYPAKEYLKGKKRLDILEVGCGYGYLSYAMSKLGHNVTGIDISKNAIKFAKSNFGGNYIADSLENFNSKNNQKFDLIVATEVIEHLTNPTEFMSIGLKLLKNEGKIILTTPNKDYYNREVIWQQEYPPVHTVFLGKSSMKKIAQITNSKLELFDMTPYFKKYYNNLVTLALMRKANYMTHYNLDENLKPDENFAKGKSSWKRKIFTKILKDFAPIRIISNQIHYSITKENSAMCAIYSKNDK